MNFFAIIIYIGLAIVCGYVHSKKGYSFIVGLICGLLLPLLSLIVILLEKEKQK